MKSAFLLLVAVVLSSTAQELQVVERGPHHQVLNRITSFLDENGKAFQRTNRITELANSLCFLPDGPDAQWELTREEFQVFENGFVADQGPMRLILAGNVNTANAIDLVTSDGKRFEISPVLLAMRDGTGQSVLISEIQDSQGQLIAPNVVLYENAFPGAAIRISYSREGIEQDCIIFDDSDFHPEAYGLIAESTTIELWSEFLSPPDSTVFPVFEDGVAKDVVVDFGSSRIAAGKAFTTDNQDVSVPVRKAYGDVNNRKFLVEKVEYSKVKPFLDQLNPNGANAGKNPAVQRMAKREVVKGDQELLAQLSGKAKLKRTASIGKPKREALMAFDWKRNPGFCIDFQLLNTTNIAGMTFQGDCTYHIAGTVTLSGTTTFEAGSVLKYTNAAKVKVTGPVSWLGSTWRPIVLTAIDDVSVGETVRANTLTGQYADVALDFDANTAAADFTLQNVRISHAKNAIRILGRSGHSISHAQFVNCSNAITLTNATSAVRNGLFYNFSNSFTGSNSTARCEHLTLDAGTKLNGNSASFTLTLTNSLLTAVTTTTGYSGSGVTVLASATGVYQTVGAGAHYLVDGSSYRNSGITGINSGLSSDFKNLTTFPPVVVSPGQLTAGVVSYSRTVERDTDTPDLGYHYSVADYAISGLYATNGTTILVNPGVVIAGYRASPSDNYIFWIDYGAKLKVQGTPSSPCRLVWYNALQEQASTAWQGDVGALVTRQTVFGTASSTEISLRFGEISTLGNSSVPVLSGAGLDTTALAISLRDSVFSGGTIAVDFHLINFTNCLFERVFSVLQGDVSDASRRANFKNCLLYGGALTTYDAGANLVSVRDTILYQSLLDTGGGSWDNGWNAYQTNGCTSCFVLSGSLSTPVINTNLTFLSGSLGRYYLPTSSILVNNGSVTNASLAGFYHYTTDTNQVKETTTGLDIGWHYVATSSSTSTTANDHDNDGIPDVVEDLDGDGSLDSGETNWQSSSDLGFAVRITEPKTSSNVP
ncbi:MAG: hypothetical protein JNN07_12665 [Verrucomicrobiales bacterium]|nr:hypothetical protein [Verrucomicrobiales bacterium]